MNIGGVRIGHANAAGLDELLERAHRSPLTYDHAGSSFGPAATRRSTTVGHGARCFDDAVAKLRSWAPQRRLGARIHPHDAPITVGTTLLVVLRLGPLELVVPNRIVSVIDDENHFGFAYGTLEGHIERGEESFLVERDGEGTVRFTISVDAVPATRLARLVPPVTRALQRAAIKRYLAALNASSSPRQSSSDGGGG